MNRALPEMLHHLNMPGNVAGVKGVEMSVLERQRLVLKWQQEQFLLVQPPHQQQDQNFINELSVLSFLPDQAAHCYQGLNMNCGPSPSLSLSLSPVPGGMALNHELLTRPIKPDPCMEKSWMPRSNVTVESLGVESVEQANSPGYGMANYGISRTASCPPLVAPNGNGRESMTAPEQKLSGAAGRESFRKRKPEKNLTPKQIDAEEESRSKKSKGCSEEEESKITEQNSNRKSNSSQGDHKESNTNNNDKKNREASGCTSKDNSKASEVQKPDYIHVRARRGQATDSHSLAERVRREKISERMKYLQELVPGCNKITGKAGMLDEIINYVQSLQRQVEFLSMKLAAVNPRLDFSIEDLIAKEVFAACSASIPTMGVTQDITNPSYIQYNPVQQMDPVCGSQVGLNPMDMGLRRSISAPVSIPDNVFDTSCFNQIPSSLPWDSDLQNIYNMEFQQVRSTSFPLQTFTGPMEASSLKMEM